MENFFYKSIPPESDKEYELIEAAREIGITVEQVLEWEQYGILKRKLNSGGKKTAIRYGEQEIMRALLVKLLLDTGLYTIEQARRRLEELG